MRFAAGKQILSAESGTRNSVRLTTCVSQPGRGRDRGRGRGRDRIRNRVRTRNKKRDSREKESRKHKKGRQVMPAYILFLVTY